MLLGHRVTQTETEVLAETWRLHPPPASPLHRWSIRREGTGCPEKKGWEGPADGEVADSAPLTREVRRGPTRFERLRPETVRNPARLHDGGWGHFTLQTETETEDGASLQRRGSSLPRPSPSYLELVYASCEWNRKV